VQVACSWAECKAAHLRACEAYANSGSLFHAAKQLEGALMVCREQQNLAEVEELAGRGGLLYRQAGSPESASQLLVKAARMVEREWPGRAVGLYEKAADTVGTEDRPAEAGQHLEKAALLAVRAGETDRAAELLHNTLGLYSEAGQGGSQQGRVVLAFVLVQLRRGDSVAAGKVSSRGRQADGRQVRDQWGGWCDGQQAAALTLLIQAPAAAACITCHRRDSVSETGSSRCSASPAPPSGPSTMTT
jgi:hypothetical protein